MPPKRKVAGDNDAAPRRSSRRKTEDVKAAAAPVNGRAVPAPRKDAKKANKTKVGAEEKQVDTQAGADEANGDEEKVGAFVYHHITSAAFQYFPFSTSCSMLYSLLTPFSYSTTFLLLFFLPCFSIPKLLLLPFQTLIFLAHQIHRREGHSQARSGAWEAVLADESGAGDTSGERPRHKLLHRRPGRQNLARAMGWYVDSVTHAPPLPFPHN